MSTMTHTPPLHSPKTESLIRGALGLAMITITVFGFIYSAASTQINQMLFPEQAAGSLIRQDDRIIGSQLVAQPFNHPGYFIARPSAADFNPMTQTGSNMARTNPALRKRIDAAVASTAARFGVAPAAVPGELVTQSGSGLDPDISPDAAAIQIASVANARHMPVDAVKALVSMHTTPPQWGLFGTPRINVLNLNLALDALAKTPSAGQDVQAASSMK